MACEIVVKVLCKCERDGNVRATIVIGYVFCKSTTRDRKVSTKQLLTTDGLHDSRASKDGDGWLAYEI
jgi:hypothetical protein